MTRRGVRDVLVAATVLCFSSCTTEVELLPPVTIEGVVTRVGSPLPAGGVEVVAVSSRGSIVATATVDAGGAYALEVNGPEACFSRIVAFVRGMPFSVESDPGLVPDYLSVVCEGVIRGPELVLPEPSASLATATVLGTVTSGGQPASAIVIFFIVSFADGPILLDTATTDSLGAYLVQGDMPAYYCNNLEVRTEPAAPFGYGVQGCSRSLVDIRLGG